MFLPKSHTQKCDCHKHYNKTKKDKNPFCDLLKNLPSNYVVENVFANGYDIGVERFINYNPNTGLAYFWNGDSALAVDCRKIDGIDFD